MKKLSDLQQSDPTKFKEVVQQISSSFASAAQNATGEDATRLNNLADKFGQAAQSGDMSALRPSHHGGHHGHHSAQSSQSSYGSQGASPAAGQRPAASQAMQDAFSAALKLVEA